MNEEKIVELATHYKTFLPPPQRLPEESYDEIGHPDPDEAFPHAAWMCDQIIDFALYGRKEKAMRWLGFVQALIWINGDESLNQIKEHSKMQAGTF